MSQMRGTQSIEFDRAIYVSGFGAVVGKKEGEGPLGSCFTGSRRSAVWLQYLGGGGEPAADGGGQAGGAESRTFHAGDPGSIYAGDLLAQCVASTFGLASLERPLYGLFGACSTMGEALSMASMAVAGGYAVSGAGSYLQPFRGGGERVPFSP